eukprot:5218103-Alexandrium_andersonii.AAC.1
MPRYEKSLACQDRRIGPSSRDEDDEESLCDAIPGFHTSEDKAHGAGEGAWATCSHSAFASWPCVSCITCITCSYSSKTLSKEASVDPVSLEGGKGKEHSGNLQRMQWP